MKFGLIFHNIDVVIRF